MSMTNSSLMCSHKPAFQQRSHPMAMRQQVNTDLIRIAYHYMGVAERRHSTIAFPAIGANNTARACSLLYSSSQASSRGIRHTLKSYSSNTSVFYFCRNDYQRLSFGTAPTFACLLSTNVALINFNCSSQIITSWGNHSTSELMEPDPCCPITPQSKDSFKPHCTRAILLTGNPPDHSKPKCQWLMRAVENRTRDNGSLVITLSALKQNGTYRPRPFMTTAQTMKTIRPAQLIKIITAVFFCRKPGLEFQKIFGVILHDLLYYILCVPESSAYPHYCK